MVMIPTAWNEGLGRVKEKVLPTYVPPPAVPKFVDTSGVGTAIGAGMQSIGSNLMDWFLQQKKEQDAKIQQAQAEQTLSKAQVDMLGLQDAVNNGVKDISNRNDLNPQEKVDALKTIMDGVSAQYKASISQDLQPHFDPHIVKMSLDANAQLADNIQKQTDDAKVADVARSLAYLEKFTVENPAGRQTAKEAGAALIDSAPLHETVKVKQTAEFKKTLDRNEVDARLNALDKGGWHVGLNKTLADLQAKDGNGAYTEYADLTPEERIAAINRAQAGIASDARMKEAIFNENAKNAVEAYKEKKLSGLPISLKEESRLYGMIKGTKYEADFLDAKQKGESWAYVMEQTAKDPFTYGAARLGIKVKDLNFSDPNQLAQNIAIGAKIKADLGLSFIPILPTDKVKGLTDLLKKDVMAGVDLMDKLTRQFGAQNVKGIAMQMEQADPKISTVMKYVADGDTLTAKAVANGQRLLSTNALTMPKEGELSSEFYKRAGTALRNYPDNANEQYNAFKAAYANAAQTAGIQGNDVSLFDKIRFKTVNSGLADIAFKQAVGDVVVLHDVKTLLPTGVSEDAFLNNIRHITPDTLTRMGGVADRNGYHDWKTNEKALQEIRTRGQFVSRSDGIYQVNLDGLPLVSKDRGIILLFNLKQ